ncbi:MAG TPA: hypothetical protein DHW02_14110 [Ktedonobacter sp.]|nr:hypothetical protein [Ktedonobacter sp.]
MTTYFLDTSALIKRYITEQGSPGIVNLCDPAQQNILYISQAARVEVVSTICRRAREKSITLDERNELIQKFREDSQKGYNTWTVTTEIYDAAGELCRSHALRAYDAIQLACALAVRTFAQKAKAPEPIFVCADNNLLNIAVAEALHIENPNKY